MFVIYGNRLYGRVDRVPGVCYVATTFMHINYVPLVPVSSWVIIDGTENSSGHQGQRIPLNWKSVVSAWLKAFLLVFGILGSLVGGCLIAEQLELHKSIATGSIVLVVLGVISLFGSFILWIAPSRAGTVRAAELIAILNPQQETRDAESESQ